MLERRRTLKILEIPKTSKKIHEIPEINSVNSLILIKFLIPCTPKPI